MNTQMNPTDAEIAGKLTGMKCIGATLTRSDSASGPWLSLRQDSCDGENIISLGIPEFVAFCRAVVGKVDGVVKTPKSCGEYLKLSEKEKLQLMKQEASK